jgi:hypothetical protein
MAPEDRNEGEGSRTAARDYNQRAREHAAKADVAGEAQDAKEAMEGEERSELDSAHERGKARAHEFDPEERKDPNKPA